MVDAVESEPAKLGHVSLFASVSRRGRLTWRHELRQRHRLGQTARDPSNAPGSN